VKLHEGPERIGKVSKATHHMGIIIVSLSDPPINAKVPSKRNVGGGVWSDWYNLRASRGAEREEGRYSLRDMRTRTAQNYVNIQVDVERRRCAKRVVDTHTSPARVACLFNARRPVEQLCVFRDHCFGEGGRQEG